MQQLARLRPVIVLFAAGLAVTSCNGLPEPAGGAHEPSRQVVPLPSTSSATPRNEPWPDRPVVALRYQIGEDRTRVEGFEHITFTPDLPVCELIFRAWPNKPETAEDGNSLVLTAAEVDGAQVTPKVEPGGAPPGHPGTLITLPLPECVSAGTPVTATLDFVLTLGPDTDERIGWSSEDRTAWFGTAFPLLAWVRGSGWATHSAVDLYGETTVSEDFRLKSLAVVAPEADEVLAVGERVSVEPGPAPGTRVHTFSAQAVRDVTVTVGDLTVVEAAAGDTTVYVGVPVDGALILADAWADATTHSVEQLALLFGPYPYEGLWVSITPDLDGGIEFPGAIQFGDVPAEIVDYLVAHEVAHMWFYGLVGNNQAEHPWLDEAFATYASALVTDSKDRYLRATPPAEVAGRLGESMDWYAELGGPAYSAGVYSQGAKALLEARTAAGAERFDAAIRTYLDTNAWTIATPEDLERALADLPEAVEVLQGFGAFSD